MHDKPQFDYHYGQESEQYTFYRIPKLLFTCDDFRSLSCEAKILYGLMLDRMSLSRKNNWIDKQNRVYIMFTLDEIQEVLDCREQKACKLLKQLETCGLIERKRLGLGRPNILFVKNFVAPQALSAENHNPGDGQQSPAPDDPGNPPDYPGDFPPNNTNKPEPQSLNDENHNSDAVDTAVQGLRKTQCSNTDSSYTDFSKINLSDPSSNGIDGKMDSHEYYEEWVKDNIEYDILVERNQTGKHYLDELVSIMVDALTSQKETIFVDGEHRPAEAVKKRLLSLDSSHIEFVQECLSENTTHVKNIKAYLLTCLWRAPETMNHRYMMLVNHHFKGGVDGK